jgi:hypothetical protein
LSHPAVHLSRAAAALVGGSVVLVACSGHSVSTQTVNWKPFATCIRQSDGLLFRRGADPNGFTLLYSSSDSAAAASYALVVKRGESAAAKRSQQELESIIQRDPSWTRRYGQVTVIGFGPFPRPGTSEDSAKSAERDLDAHVKQVLDACQKKAAVKNP